MRRQAGGGDRRPDREANAGALARCRRSLTTLILWPVIGLLARLLFDRIIKMKGGMLTPQSPAGRIAQRIAGAAVQKIFCLS